MSTIGSFIWYELMTSDATAVAKFYGAVVGWKIADRPDPQGGMDYRMIGRSDGGYNGGVLELTTDMVDHGARPTWLGYLHVADVDGAVKSIEADGGRLLMPRKDLPVGAIAMVADPMDTHALLRDGADSATGKARREERCVRCLHSRARALERTREP